MNTEAIQPPIWFKGTMPSDWVIRFTVGNDPAWDTMLLPFDIEATRAHVLGLVRAGVMTNSECDRVRKSLVQLRQQWEKGNIAVSVEDEDSHTLIENFLTKELGVVGKKVHTARSRNDQVLAALRLWIRSQLDATCTTLSTVVDQLLGIAEKEAATFLPGYTHMQRAMPSSVGLWAAGFAEALVTDFELIVQARSHINTSPLGSAAGYGVPCIELDRPYVAELLGFDHVQENVTTVQLTRGKLELTVVHSLLQMACTINRLASDLVLYSTAEFGFIEFDEDLTTGSSMMPQKRNADVAELARASLHRIAAEAQVLIGIPANLPSGYHRDLQLTKEAAMRAVLCAGGLVQAVEHLLPGLSFRKDRLNEKRDPSLFATAAVMARVSNGESFREAYRAVGANPEDWSEAAKASAVEMYQYAGTPGRPNVEAVRKRLSRIKYSSGMPSMLPGA